VVRPFQQLKRVRDEALRTQKLHSIARASQGQHLLTIGTVYCSRPIVVASTA
jgi:hypothetical protein